mgnify:CR=1 FL=1
MNILVVVLWLLQLIQQLIKQSMQDVFLKLLVILTLLSSNVLLIQQEVNVDGTVKNVMITHVLQLQLLTIQLMKLVLDTYLDAQLIQL